MPILEDIQRVFRDFVRYTGDGKPGAPSGAPLPIGDPRSGIFNPSKDDLRQLLFTMAQTMGDPSALQGILAQLSGLEVFPNLAAGRAAVPDGGKFQVDTGDEVILYRRDSSTTQTVLARYAGAAISGSIADLKLQAGQPVTAIRVVENTATTQHTYSRSSGPLVVGNRYALTVRALPDPRYFELQSPSGVPFRVYVDPVTLEATVASGDVESVTATREGIWVNLTVVWTEVSASARTLFLRLNRGLGGVTYQGDGTGALWVSRFALTNLTIGAVVWDVRSASEAAAGAATATDAVSPASLIANMVIASQADIAEARQLVAGERTMTRLTEGTGSVTPTLALAVPAIAGEVSRIEADIKIASGDRRFGIRFVPAGSTTEAVFDPIEGVVESVADGAVASMEHLGNDVYRCRVERASASTASVAIALRVWPVTGGPTYTGDGTSGIFLQEVRYYRNDVLQTRSRDFLLWTASGLTLTPNAGTFIGLRDAVEKVPSILASLRSSSRVIIWGDSMAEGTGSTNGQTLPVQLRLLLNRQVEGRGAGSQKAEQIAARNGARAALLTVAGNQIPASGGVSVTAFTIDPCFYAATSLSLTGWLAGVHGTLRKVTASGGASEIISYTFTRTDGGAVVRCLPGTPFIPDRTMPDRLHVLWLGRNNYGGVTDPAALAAVNALIKECIAAIRTSMASADKRVIILGVPSNNVPAEYVGTPNFNAKRDLARDLAQTYPKNFIDIDAILRDSGDGSAADSADIANGIAPSSKRADSVHYNNVGYAIAAQEIASRVLQNGW